MNAQKVSEVINNIVGTYGIDILADSKRFNALFDDFAPELDEERRIFHRVINEEILNSFFMIKNLSETEQKNELLKIDKRIREFMGFSSSWSYFVIDSFSLAFNCENPLTFDECNESVDNFSSGSEDDLDLFKVNRAIYKKIAVGPHHALGVTESGQVIAVGFNGNGQCEVSGWNNIVEVSTALLVKTSNEEYTPVQLLPVYLFWATISCMLIWTPSILLNKNAEVIALQNVIDKVAANVHTELIPLVIAAAIGILSAVISMIVGKKCLGDILKIIVCNAFCIAIVLTIHKNVFINKFSNVVCILSLLYALLFEEKHRIKNSSLYWIIISLNCFGLFLYNIIMDMAMLFKL